MAEAVPPEEPAGTRPDVRGGPGPGGRPGREEPAGAQGVREEPAGQAGREELARAQAGLLAALVAGAQAPPGFDGERLRIQTASLVAKRRSVVARLRPDLVQTLGEDFRAEFAAYASGRPRPPGGSRADAADFAGHLVRTGRIPAGAGSGDRAGSGTGSGPGNDGPEAGSGPGSGSGTGPPRPAGRWARLTRWLGGERDPWEDDAR
ncbi:hypothetical protein Ppa06_28740 [Planomonospora parontospora subsp. parontospora]|uniref:SCO6045-like C-terminal domain-containing protein n=2 Tax=Planomonospora parontospora TaxID=58119 RepID=A0AA37BGE3_9ACTN|nr:hypothetical protein [Planomonospora parontospora]GGK68125.1 hypothetical protein GCM10010126_29420 [Planomonospora parontospora]GII09076.1 hypothetical protein Ppa06_28740 [Planomonospora parontospora subsp. parontospora]